MNPEGCPSLRARAFGRARTLASLFLPARDSAESMHGVPRVQVESQYTNGCSRPSRTNTAEIDRQEATRAARFLVGGNLGTSEKEGMIWGTEVIPPPISRRERLKHLRRQVAVDIASMAACMYAVSTIVQPAGNIPVENTLVPAANCVYIPTGEVSAGFQTINIQARTGVDQPYSGTLTIVFPDKVMETVDASDGLVKAARVPAGEYPVGVVEESVNCAQGVTEFAGYLGLSTGTTLQVP
ncbi:MAG TPA: hypothetical protein VMB52_03750 [Verrucomicrobiae bacterium]|nr:hypothetical protein [Verrucomicrobiae bacterium]